MQEKNNGLIGKIFMPIDSDGRVEVESVLTDDASDFIILPFGHKEIHHKEKTLMMVKNYLLNGRFIV